MVVAACALALVATCLLGRQGTFRTRLFAGLLFACTVAAVFAFRWFRQRRFRSTSWVVDRLVGAVEPDAAGRLLRALSLLDEAGKATDEGASPELARLHVERSVAAVPEGRVLVGAGRSARRFLIAGFALALGTLVATAIDPWAVLEGANVLAARRGVAPLPMDWIDDIDVRARPPEYLHIDETRVMARKLELPRGTLLTLRGHPIHSGRRLFLSDGTTEIPFVDDGTGRVVARWPLGESAQLRVVARFGNVVVEEPVLTSVVSIPDRAPEVKLEGAPQRIALAGEAEVTEIPVKYEATDDHGLREVHLVLRSGPREERRVLAKLDGETKSDRGGYVLRAADAFVKKSNAPIEIVVEAKDNDPITGPKWGASAAITLVPPHVGEPEARRIEALKRLRDALVDRLAQRIDKPIPPAGEPRKHYVAELVEGADADADLLDSVLSSSYAGLRIPGRIQAMFRAQSRKLDDAVRAHARGPSTTTLSALLRHNERFALVVDAAMRGFGTKDARDAAKRLVDVAEDLAGELGFLAQAESRRNTPELPRRVQHADAATQILSGSAAAMRRIGTLGKDLGGAVDAALVRVDRARKATDLPHAELAARDLVARLRHPDPSFGSQGSGHRAGGESGGARGMMEEGEEEANEVERAFDEAAKELEQLIGDHARQKGETEAAMSGASPEELKQFADEAKKHADAVREATAQLPTVGGGSDSWTSKGAAAREHSEQMAHSLEQGNPSDAVASGKNALGALDEAKRQLRSERWSRFSMPGELDPERRIEDAKKKLEPEIRWAEERLEAMRRRSAERASGELQRGGENEQRLAERMGKLADKGKERGALPAPAIDSLDAAERAAHEASRALRELQTDKGLERQAEAQRMLEMARESLGEESQPQDNRNGDDGPIDLSHADIPKADAHRGPEEFRRRVIQGLGQPSSGRLKDAIRRYAEGLLR
jgi:hypothetical protein